MPTLTFRQCHQHYLPSKTSFRCRKGRGTNPNNSPGLPVALLNPKCGIILQVHNWAFLSIRLVPNAEEHHPSNFRYGEIPFLISVPGLSRYAGRGDHSRYGQPEPSTHYKFSTTVPTNKQLRIVCLQTHLTLHLLRCAARLAPKSRHRCNVSLESSQLWSGLSVHTLTETL